MAEFEVNTGVNEDSNEEQLSADKQPQAAESTADDLPTPSQEPRKTHRVRKLTEKGQELHDEQIKKATYRFSVSYEKWKAIIKDAQKAIDGQCSKDLLQEHVAEVTNAVNNVNVAYVELRRIESPDNDTRRRMDTCEAVTRKFTDAAECCPSQAKVDSLRYEQIWKETDSVFKSTASDKTSVKSHYSKLSSHSKVSSRHSSRHSAKTQDAAAEVAANEATLQVLLEQENHIKEIERQEAEIAQKQRELEAKRREVERLETVKKLNAAKARQQVYERSECSDAEIYSLLHHSSDQEKEVKPKNNDSPTKMCFSPQVVIPPQELNATDLVKTFAEILNASRLPVPEPTVFSGNPLRYSDWKISFQTLIDRRSIPAEEKIYYLRKYVGGAAKKAIESYFLLGSKSAYNAAWTVLEERYGDPFIIAKAFRDKLAAWPKVNSKSSVELQEFADFLCSCRAAMSQIKGLQVLDDCNENRKMLAELPDWLEVE
ncbi:hypothetical protein JOB18_032575 [Solea senegalensis]|uniref:Uncharacterized protein n=1 Tax=Solea senegalensis TaxID=28829 RepID=A0AAV6QQW8_SOLSE|nr:hypothetical protein JOB18_032575 [Solea senegalensis]